MMWLTWRQFRAQAWVTLAILAVIAIGLAISGLHLARLYNTSGIPGCRSAGDCTRVAADYLGALRAGAGYTWLYQATAYAVYAAPAVVGAFWGAPLISRELEAGTLRLAWTQSVSRTRWLAVKAGLIGLASMATAGLVSLMVTWWAAPVDRADALAGAGAGLAGRFSTLLFGARDITPVGYAAFAFALGVAAGLLLRRTVAAMAASLAIFIAAEVAVALWLRPHLLPALRSLSPLRTAAINYLAIQGSRQITVIAAVNRPGAWILSNETVTAAGRPFTGPAPAACSSRNPLPVCERALGTLHLRQLVTYQPLSRYWAFQGIETALFGVLAVTLAGFCYWWVRRRNLA
jgi:ABC-type transport system involved in multi-copper enzyme maturation permease subunit